MWISKSIQCYSFSKTFQHISTGEGIRSEWLTHLCSDQSPAAHTLVYTHTTMTEAPPTVRPPHRTWWVGLDSGPWRRSLPHTRPRPAAPANEGAFQGKRRRHGWRRDIFWKTPWWTAGPCTPPEPGKPNKSPSSTEAPHAPSSRWIYALLHGATGSQPQRCPPAAREKPVSYTATQYLTVLLVSLIQTRVSLRLQTHMRSCAHGLASNVTTA